MVFLIKANVAAAAPNSSFDVELNAPRAAESEATVMAATAIEGMGEDRAAPDAS
jgi:hypothetical protein